MMVKCQGVVNDVPITVDELKPTIDFLVVGGVLVGVLILIPNLERLSAQIDQEGQYVDFTIGGKSLRVDLYFHRSIKRSAGDESEDVDFTTDSIDASSEDESDGDSEYSMEVALAVMIKIFQQQ